MLGSERGLDRGSTPHPSETSEAQLSARLVDVDRIDGLLKAVDAFVESVVIPLEQDNHALLSDPRRRYLASGAPAPEIVEMKRTVRMASALAGLYTLTFPTSLGGQGLEPTAEFAVWEHLHETYGPDRPLPYDVVANSTSGPGAALSEMSAKIRRDLWPGILSGEKVLCFALSEPIGTPPTPAMTTFAVRDDSTWLISGTKRWVSRGAYAEYALVYAVTDPDRYAKGDDGTSAFLIPLDSTGVQIEGIDRLLGRVGGEEATIVFEHVRVPNDNLIGDSDRGGEIASRGAAPGAMFTAGRFCGLGKWALARALDFATTHGASGIPISDSPTVQIAIADSAIEIYAAHEMAVDCARRLEEGVPSVAQMAMVRTFTTEMCARVFERCIQVFGGEGLTNDERLFDGWHQSRIVRAAEGGAEPARRSIAREFLARRARFGR